jgi:hypothetical protein
MPPCQTNADLGVADPVGVVAAAAAEEAAKKARNLDWPIPPRQDRLPTRRLMREWETGIWVADGQRGNRAGRDSASSVGYIRVSRAASGKGWRPWRPSRMG